MGPATAAAPTGTAAAAAQRNSQEAATATAAVIRYVRRPNHQVGSSLLPSLAFPPPAPVLHSAPHSPVPLSPLPPQPAHSPPHPTPTYPRSSEKKREGNSHGSTVSAASAPSVGIGGRVLQFGPPGQTDDVILNVHPAYAASAKGGNDAGGAGGRGKGEGKGKGSGRREAGSSEHYTHRMTEEQLAVWRAEQSQQQERQARRCAQLCRSCSIAPRVARPTPARLPCPATRPLAVARCPHLRPLLRHVPSFSHPPVFSPSRHFLASVRPGFPPTAAGVGASTTRLPSRQPSLVGPCRRRLSSNCGRRTGRCGYPPSTPDPSRGGGHVQDLPCIRTPGPSGLTTSLSHTHTPTPAFPVPLATVSATGAAAQDAGGAAEVGELPATRPPAAG